MIVHTPDVGVFARQGFAQPAGFGARCAVVLVDFTVGFRDPGQFGGGRVEEAIVAATLLLDVARELEAPIAHSRIVFGDDGAGAGAWALKVPALRALTEANPATHFVAELAPREGELVIRKRAASAFFDSPLSTWLKARGVDTVVVAGVTTSGCVRATVVDAVSHDLRTVVVADGCSDRYPPSHDMSLFEMQQKYADVMPVALAIQGMRDSAAGRTRG
jgi:maleamate amidohydrolase